jgi:hypothetical protein
MAESIADIFAGTVTTKLQWSRVDSQEVGSVTNKKTASSTYTFGDGETAGSADLVYADTRTIAANGVDTLDFGAITQQTLGVAVPFAFSSVRIVRVTNNETAAGKQILVGCSEDSPFAVYAQAVGPDSEFLAVNRQDAWEVTEGNRIVRISNPNAGAASYSIVIIGAA